MSGADSRCPRSIRHIGLETELECSAAFNGIVLCQRRIVGAGGYGGQEKLSCKHCIYLPFVRFARLEQSAHSRPETATDAQTCLGDPCQTGTF